MLVVPDNLSRNEKRTQEMADPADTGAALIDYMCRRIGIQSLAGKDVLDLGCGVRFSQAIINRNLPVGTYTGIEVNRPIVDFLTTNVTDPRFAFHYANVANQFYNRKEDATDAPGASVLGDRTFDVACMFSVITHQEPGEASSTFRFLRSHVRPTGHLFFSAFIHDDPVEFQQLVPEKPGLKASYSRAYMEGILRDRGWEIVSMVDPLPEDLPIMTSFLCEPA